MMLFNVFVLLFFASGASACNGDKYNRENLIDIQITRKKITGYHNELRISSKELTVLIIVDVSIPFIHSNFHSTKLFPVTVDALACRDDKSQYLVINNTFFFHKSCTRYSDMEIVNRFISTQKLITPKVTNGEWEWVCKLSTRWEGCTKCEKNYDFRIKIFDIQNEANEITPLHEYHGPAEPKQLNCESKDIKHVDIPLRPYFVECDKASPTWVTFSVVSVSVFVVGLVIGVFCRRPRDLELKPKHADDQMDEHVYNEVVARVINNMESTRALELKPKHADDQTDEHVYNEVVTKGINNRPPLPLPQQAEYIYNSPYDHTHRYQHEMRLKSNNRNQ